MGNPLFYMLGVTVINGDYDHALGMLAEAERI